MSTGSFFRKIRERLAFRSWYTDELLRDAHATRVAAERTAFIAQEQHLAQVLADARYADPLRLERFGFKTYSQSDQDGIIREIFNRIGTTNKLFVEFGAGAGVENNTHRLLLEGWKGLWIEGDQGFVAIIKALFPDLLATDKLLLKEAFITNGNINELIAPWRRGEIDLLSIDVDGNDYYMFEALRVIDPRVVVIEYNARFRPPVSVVQQYQPTHKWSGGNSFGASLEALVRLGKRRRYWVVGCNITGQNAFFVRDDLVNGKFQAPFSAENHYQPSRYFLGPLHTSGRPPERMQYIEVSD
jgi:hypothetical protein